MSEQDSGAMLSEKLKENEAMVSEKQNFTLYCFVNL